MDGNGQKPGNEVPPCLDASDLDRQVRMISDSLVACKMMSNHRPTVKRDTLGFQTTARPNILPQTSLKVLLPPEERILECFPRNRTESMIVSYVGRDKTDFKMMMEEESFSEESGDVIFQEESTWSWEETIPKGSSKVGMYKYEEVDPLKMLEVIERELKGLMEMAPASALIVSGLSDYLFHYKECARCKEKIRPSLPLILNRIQKLRKYVTTKNHGTYKWPNDYSYLRLPTSPKTPLEEVLSIPQKPKTQIGKLEKIEACAIFDDRPGVQILLDVKPEKGRKRFFEKVKTQSITKKAIGSFPAFHLKTPASDPLIHILRPKNEGKVVLKSKREITEAKGFAVAIPVLIQTPRPKLAESELVSTPGAGATAVQIARSQVYPKPIEFYEERTLRIVESPITVLEQRAPKRKELVKKLKIRDFRANATGLVRELLDEAEEEKMQVQKVKELESIVKALKDLMLEVQKNQVELSKVLLEKGVCSTPIIKLTDPNMLEEENQVVRQAAQIEVHGIRRSSIEALQLMVNDLKRKCDVKNRMLVTLLKGLRSNVPKEWWEELVDYIFDETKPVEAFDPEKVSEFVQQTSLFLLGGQKASSQRPRYEEQPSEEESKMMERITEEEEVEDAPNAKDEVRVVAFPNDESDAGTKAAIRKLESQISALNDENDRLWEQVKELREALMDSMSDIQSKDSNHHYPLGVAKASGKTIKLTIQIAEKSSKHSDVSASRSQNSTEDASQKVSFRLLSDERVCSKSKRRRSENDLNYLDDTIPEPFPKPSKLKSYAENKPSPRPSNLSVSSKTFSERPGPSSNKLKPVMELAKKQNLELSALMANERELQTIPESDDVDCIPLARTPRAGGIERLKTKLRTMHDDVEVLKSKNDRIDRLLNSLVDDAIENSESYEKIESDFRNFESRFG